MLVAITSNCPMMIAQHRRALSISVQAIRKRIVALHWLRDSKSGHCSVVLSLAPGLQVFSGRGRGMDGEMGKGFRLEQEVLPTALEPCSSELSTQVQPIAEEQGYVA